MRVEQQNALMLAEQINGFIQFVKRSYENKNSIFTNLDRIYQIKLWTEDFKFQIIADELIRINQYDWDEKYTHYLVNQFQKGINNIEEYVKIYYDDLFLFAARLHTLKNSSQLFHLQTGAEQNE